MAVNVKRGGGRSAPPLGGGAVETPSQRIVNGANKLDYVMTTNGVRLGIRKLGAFDEMRITKAVGRDAANEQYMMWCMLAAAIASIDDDALPLPQTPLEFEAIIKRIGDDGVAALQKRGVEMAAAAAAAARQGDLLEDMREAVGK